MSKFNESKYRDVVDTISGIKCLKEDIFHYGHFLYPSLYNYDYKIFVTIDATVKVRERNSGLFTSFSDFFEALKPNDKEQFLFHLDLFA